MPQGPMSSPLMKPFVVLALPGMYLFYKYNQYKRKRRESARRRLTEKELQHLNNKIDKLLSKLEESEPELAKCQEEECVICINAKATMQTAPCGHQVVCRKCFVKTIQIAVSQRLLPLRCVICRAKILRLKTGSVLPNSASGYSVNSRTSSVPASDSLYSVSSGGSSNSCTSDSSGASGTCCGGTCLGAYPRQPTGALRRSQQHAMKMKLQEYCHPDRSACNRLPPIKELPCSVTGSPTVPPVSTRIRCAQKIVTQLETVPLLGKSTNHFRYEKLSEPDKNRKKYDKKYTDNGSVANSGAATSRDRSSERDDNKRNELVEKQLELKEKLQKVQQATAKTDTKKSNDKSSKRDAAKEEKSKKDKKKS